jgi:hypothetical protein
MPLPSALGIPAELELTMRLDRSLFSLRATAPQLACLCLLLIGACNAPSASNPPAATVSDEPALAAPSAMPSISQDPELAALVQRLAKGCRVEASILQCNSDERLAVADQFIKNERSRVAALPTLTSVLFSGDETQTFLTAELMATGFSIGFGGDAKPGDVNKSVATELLDALRRLPPYRARRLAGVATHAAMLAGEQQALFKTLDEIGDEDLAVRALNAFMVYGRLGVFDTIKEKMTGSDRQRVGAMTAVRAMPSWTAEEQSVLCPWVLEYLEDASAGVSSRAAQTLNACVGEQVDLIQWRVEQLHAEGKLERTTLIALRDVCKDARHLADGRCAKVVAFLRSIAQDPKNPTDLRTAALAALHYQVPQSEKVGALTGRALLKQLGDAIKRDKDAEVALAAKNMLRHLERAP